MISTEQEMYDGFNAFMFSRDINVLSKMLARSSFFNSVKDVPGDIVECGVFKGSGMMTWLKLKKLELPNSIKKVIGFDIFDTDKLVNSLSDVDKEPMSHLFESRNYKHTDISKTEIESKIINCGFTSKDFELVEGDISKTASEYVKRNIGFRISLLYLDLDLCNPTYSALESFWPLMSKNGIVIFDEYAYHEWSESNGVDNFFKDKNVRIVSTGLTTPTAFVMKN